MSTVHDAPPSADGDAGAASAGDGAPPNPGATAGAAAESPLPGQQSAPPAASFAGALAGRTSRIVQQAASILEEELAAGIVAAREVEARFVDVPKVRGADAKEVMQRFRRDAHDVVDILIDMVTVATNAVGGIAQRAVTVRTGTKGADGSPAPAAFGTPSLDVPHKVRAGESIEVPLAVENAGDAPTEAIEFHSSDLVSATGARITAGRVSFAPPALVIAPGQSEVVKVTLSVPADTPPGIYAGLLQASKLHQLRAVVTVQIE
jgi:hypothetical protein